MRIHKVDIALFSQILRDCMGLKVMPVIRVKSQVKMTGDLCFGLYEGDIVKNKFVHKIIIAKSMVKSRKALFATIAHEFVHAWQMENSVEVDHSVGSSYEAWYFYFKTAYNIDITED
jgi:hypothetical protein